MPTRFAHTLMDRCGPHVIFSCGDEERVQADDYDHGQACNFSKAGLRAGELHIARLTLDPQTAA